MSWGLIDGSDLHRRLAVSAVVLRVYAKRLEDPTEPTLTRTPAGPEHPHLGQPQREFGGPARKGLGLSRGIGGVLTISGVEATRRITELPDSSAVLVLTMVDG